MARSDEFAAWWIAMFILLGLSRDSVRKIVSMLLS